MTTRTAVLLAAASALLYAIGLAASLGKAIEL